MFGKLYTIICHGHAEFKRSYWTRTGVGTHPCQICIRYVCDNTDASEPTQLILLFHLDVHNHLNIAP